MRWVRLGLYLWQWQFQGQFLAAGIAFALPAVIRRAAVLADEGESGFCHGGVSRRLEEWRILVAWKGRLRTRRPIEHLFA